MASHLIEKKNKLNRIQGLLQDPDAGLLESTCWNFLPNSVAAKFGVIDTQNVSSNNYSPQIIRLIEDNPDKLFLDCGAGKRAQYYANVVNLEVVAYWSTDVLSVAENLPFKDGVFDYVLSFAVLEHVKNPFLAAKEISRTIKPGGFLHCVVPFMQAFHGYPDHFYNMTISGLTNLFENELLIIHKSVPLSGKPIYSLLQMLRIWQAGLSGKTRDHFRNLTIGELVDKRAVDLLGTEYVLELNAVEEQTIASTNYIVCKKPIDGEVSVKLPYLIKHVNKSYSSYKSINSDKGVITIKSVDNDPFIVFDSSISGLDIKVNLAIDAPTKTTGHVFWSSSNKLVFNKSRCIPLVVNKGYNKYTLHLSGDFNGKLRLDPGSAKGTYKIQMLELLNCAAKI